MLWGCAPASHGGGLAQETPAEPLVSRELLRSVCEPFFEQMLTALQQALQQTQKQQFSKDAQIMQPTLQMTKISSFQSASRPISHQLSRLDPMLDEESTEADELGAFASLLSGPSSEGESIDSLEAKSPEVEVVFPVAQSDGLDEAGRSSCAEKSNMVCRHWKTKGFCRLESSCKFLHPEHKRGATARKCCIGGSANIGGISRATHPGMSTILNLCDAIVTEENVTGARGKKQKGCRDRSHGGQQVQIGSQAADPLT